MAADCRRYGKTDAREITRNGTFYRTRNAHGGVDAAATDKRDSSHHTVYRTHSRRRCGRKTIPYDKQNPRCASIAHRGFCFVFAFYQSLPQSVSLLSQLSQSQSLSQSSSRPEP